MKVFLKRGAPALALVAVLAWCSGGCGQPAAETKATTKDKAVAKNDGGPSTAPTGARATKDPGQVKDDHSGYWCDEHGLPEAVCDLCSKKYRESEKAKGNWCEHNRVKTSCFKCNPGLKEKFAAEYKAKTGKDTPPTEDDEKKDEGKPEK